MLICQPMGFGSIQGRSIQLSRSSIEYIDFIYQCYKNDEFMDLYRLAQNREISKPELEKRILKEQSQLPQNVKRIEWVILKKSNDTLTPVGLASLADYQVNHRRAELLIGITSPESRNFGVSLEASLLVMDFAFNQINLNKISSYVYGYNEKAQKNTLHLGFTQEGLLVEHINSPKGFIDLYQNGLIKKNFLQNKVLAKLSLRLLDRDITQAEPPIKIQALSNDLLHKLKDKMMIVSSK